MQAHWNKDKNIISKKVTDTPIQSIECIDPIVRDSSDNCHIFQVQSSGTYAVADAHHDAYATIIEQIAFEFPRPEIEKVVHEGVLPCRFDLFDR